MIVYKYVYNFNYFYFYYSKKKLLQEQNLNTSTGKRRSSFSHLNLPIFLEMPITKNEAKNNHSNE